MQTYQQDFQLKGVKALDDQTGTFTGYASTYGGSPDLVGDVILPGAFKRSIDNQNANGLPLLWSHQASEPLGLAKVSDSASGLVVTGSMVMADPAAQRAYAHLKAGSVRGLSIGYSIPSGGATVDAETGVRRISTVKLFEVSLVAIPANPLAQVTSVKSLAQVDQLLRNFKAGDVDAETLASLQAINGTLRGLLRKDALCDCECPECLDGNCMDCSNADCDDVNCIGTMAKIATAAELASTTAALKSFALELKTIIG